MKTKNAYLILSFLGITLPYSQFIPWMVENGFNIPLFLEQIYTSRIAAFGWLDVIVSAVVLILFALTDGRKYKVPHFWLPLLGTVTVGVSFGLPLYLYLRGRSFER